MGSGVSMFEMGLSWTPNIFISDTNIGFFCYKPQGPDTNLVVPGLDQNALNGYVCVTNIGFL